MTGGLYARLRHPNYLGEIVFQAGPDRGRGRAAPGGWALAAGVAGPLYIAILMYYAAHDQDHQQGQRYGADPAYQSWREPDQLPPAGTLARGELANDRQLRRLPRGEEPREHPG